MASTPSSSQDPSIRWSTVSDDQLTQQDITECLPQITDDLWVAAACVDRLVGDPTLQRSLLDLGLQRTELALERSKRTYDNPSSLVDQEEQSGGPSTVTEEEHKRLSSLSSHFRSEPSDAQLCYLRTVLLDRLDRLNTFVEIWKDAPQDSGNLDEDIDDEWVDDPWADNASSIKKSRSSQSRIIAEPPPLPFSSFLVNDLLSTACLLASLEHFTALRIFLDKHGSSLWPHRFTILDSIPEYTPASLYRDLLPALDPTSDKEAKPHMEPWRVDIDWTELPGVQEVTRRSLSTPTLQTESDSPLPQSDPLPSHELSLWYRDRIDRIISATGMIDVALSLVQHAVSRGVAELDEVGEELSLLSRLVYDVGSASGSTTTEDWTLERWKSLEPSAAVRAYLANSTPGSIRKDINRLVMPYLFVLESRAERAGHPDPSLPTRLLHEYVLGAPLDIVAAIFESSKPTLPPAQRILKDDEDMARIALACLYGSDELRQWPTMSRIFECLPAWETPEDEDESDEADTTIASLGAFVVPSTTRPRCTPSDLLLFFKPLPPSSLSRALDVLDVHLESGEILSRWSVPAPLRWFLQSNGSIAEQRAWANRMARQTGGIDDRLESLEDWEWLLEDMLKLAGSGESGLKGAFCLLSKDDVGRIFFAGLISSGKFGMAKNLLRSRGTNLQLEPSVVEDICLSCSQEFYDNAPSGNYHFGDMKLAYDCLDVPQSSERIVKEKEFIEATSRLCSFNLMSRPGIPISPIEIRLTKDRLSLVSRVLSSNNDAYKHTKVILDLVNKLGFRGDVVAEVKTLAMLADTALQTDDFTRAYETSERMVKTVLQLRKSSSPSSPKDSDPKTREASEVCWVACFQLGRHPEFEDVPKKLTLLGYALELCPSEQLVDILTAFHRLESEDIEERQARLDAIANSHHSGGGNDRPRPTDSHHNINKRSTQNHRSGNPSTVTSLTSRLQQLRMSSPSLVNAPDAAALANKAFSAAANFTFGVGAKGRSLLSDEAQRRPRSGSGRAGYDGSEVSAQATRVLQKGLGWLLGDEE